MDNNNWRPIQGGEPVMDTTDWRTQLQPDSRQRIVNKIMDILKKHLPFSGQEGLHELKKIAERFEEKIYTAARSQNDYLRKISLKMLTMEIKSQNTIPNSLPSNPVGTSSRPPDPGSLGMQPQVHNQGQPLAMPLPPNQSQTRQQLLSQNIQNSAAVQSSSSLSSALPPTSSGQNSIPSVVGQNTNMQNMPGNSQNSIASSMGQGVPANMYANSQRQMQGRQPVVPQQQQQSQNPQQQYLYQQPQQMLKPKFPQGNIPQSMMQSHIQQQQQNLLQPTQLQSSQQAVVQTSPAMQPPMMQSSLPSLQQNQPSVLRQQQQPQQAAVPHQQQAQMSQQQQQQQLMGQQPNSTNMQQSHLIGQQNNVGDLQQQQRLLGQQNNLSNLQQQQQQLMAQQNNLSNLHQQQLGPQSNVSGLQQQQLLGTQTGNSGMQTNQHPVHMLQQPKPPLQQQPQQNGSNMLPTQAQQSQPQQQMLSQIQTQPTQMQQQLGLQQQPNQLQRDMPQRLQAPGQTSGSLLQTQNVIDPQKQLYQSQRPLPETSSTSVDSTAQTGHANGGDWQEEVYQKIKQMKDLYLHELRDMYEKIAAKLQQLDSLPQQPKLEQLDKLKLFKNTLERAIQFLQVPKGNIGPMYKEKLAHYEKQIISFINTNRPRKPVSQLQQGQHPQYHMHSMQQQPQSQINQVQSHEKQMNPQLQSMNLQSMQQNNMTSLQQHSMPAKCVLTTQQNVMNSSQSSSNVDSGQGNAQNSLQQVSMGSLQQNPVIAPQQANINALSLKNGINVLQPSVNNLEPNSNMLQHQHQLKQQEQQMIQKLKQQYHQWQLLQKQQIFQQQQQQQQLQQQAKPQIPAQLPSHQNQMLQLHQINDVNDMKMRQSMGAKPGVFQQHLPAGQRSAYSHQQLKSSSPFPISSSQLLQASSPQILQHSSPQVDQQNLLTSLTKPGTPLQSANSPFVVPSPSTPMAPSPMPGDSEKPVPSVSSLSNAGNVRQQQTSGAVAPAQSLSIGTPGISASPLLAEFSGPDGTHVFSVMGKRRLLYALVVFGWILVTVTFILGGVFLLLHKVGFCF